MTSIYDEHYSIVSKTSSSYIKGSFTSWINKLHQQIIFYLVPRNLFLMLPKQVNLLSGANVEQLITRN